MIFDYTPNVSLPFPQKGELVITKYWHLKQKRVISVPGILLSKIIDMDQPECVIYSILIIEPNSNCSIIHQTQQIPEFVSCKNL